MPYDDNDFCEYNVLFTRSDVCFLSLTYLTFDLEPSPGCVRDFFVVRGEKQCGVRTGTILYPVAPGKEAVKLVFSSGKAFKVALFIERNCTY